MHQLRKKSPAFGSAKRLDQPIVSFIDGGLHFEQHGLPLLRQGCAFCSTIFRIYFTADDPTRLQARQDA
jgi:hypothetical protein